MSHPAGGAGRPGRARQVGDPSSPSRTGYVPPGWPREVLPPAVEGWEESAVAWMLDYGPSERRLEGYETLRHHPLFMAWFFRQLSAADLAAARESWRALRAAQDVPDPEQHTAQLQGLTRIGRGLRDRAQAAELLERAMRGELFVPRL